MSYSEVMVKVEELENLKCGDSEHGFHREMFQAWLLDRVIAERSGQRIHVSPKKWKKSTGVNPPLRTAGVRAT